MKQRNERCDEKVPESILLTDKHEELCHWLCVCVNELRKGDGSEYTPRNISQFVVCLQQYISIRLVDPTNPTFWHLHLALDNRYRELHAKGVGTKRRQAEVVSSSEEDQLWKSGVLSSDSPGGLLRAVFYLNGINFVLRGGAEHRNLKIYQLTFLDVPDPDNCKLVHCVQHGSKNRPGGSHQLNQENNTICQRK